jgi:hypothetical protein
MIAWSKPLPDSREPVEACAARARLRRLAALTGLRRPGSLASKRSWLHASGIAPVATRAEIGAPRSAAWTSAVLWIGAKCHTGAMAHPHKSRRRIASFGATPDDLYDYARPRDPRPGRLAAADAAVWTVKDDWPEDVPVTEYEIEVFEAWFSELFDEFFSTRH